MSNETVRTPRATISWSDYKIDPRYFILLFLLSFAVIGQLYLGFFQKWDAFIVAVITSTLTEILIHRLKHKSWSFPLSAVITGVGISLLLSSHQVWPYAVASFLAISLKYLIRFKGGHVFNPNNLAMVILLLSLPQYVVSTPKQWSNGFGVMILILLFGLIVTYLANRLDIVLTFLGSFVFFALIRHHFFAAPLYAALGPLLSAGLQLFAFFMITDPKSSPATRKWRIAFAFFVALLDAIFRIQRIPNPQFYALFSACILLVIPYRIWASSRSKT